MLKSHFRYTKSQRNGILFLTSLIILLLFLNFFVDFSSEKTVDLKSSEIQKFQQEIDSITHTALESKKSKIYPFNPSFISDFKGYQLGMSVEEIDRLLEYRAQGKYINSTKEFQEVTGVSDSLLNVISPYFKFPDWLSSQQTTYRNKNNKSVKLGVQDLNTVSAKELKIIKGIGDKLSERIIKYRTYLNGYSFNDQLYEVWGLEKEIADRVLTNFKVLSKPTINKVNINTASFKEVLALPYIDYDLTKKIFDFRDEVAELQSLEELKQIEGFPVDKYDRIAVYLLAK